MPRYLIPLERTWFTKGLRPVPWRRDQTLPSLERTWFTKGLRRFGFNVYCFCSFVRKDLIYEGITTKNMTITSWDLLLLERTWFTKGLRLRIGISLISNWIVRKDLIYEGITTNNNDCLHNNSPLHVRKDLIYEGITTKTWSYLLGKLMYVRKDLIYEGITTIFGFSLLNLICLC